MNNRLEDRIWTETEVGQGRIVRAAATCQLTVGATAAGRYSNAQITDYDYAAMAFRWRPPLRMTVRAWFETRTPAPSPYEQNSPGRGELLGNIAQSGAASPGETDSPTWERGAGEERADLVPVGTAGFGFWNHPFSPDTRRLRLPQAIWFFFGAPPHNLALAAGVPGYGWKAATIDAGRPAALPLAPFAPLAVLAMQSPAVYRRLYPFIQRRLAISEAALAQPLMTAPHTYTLEWRRDGAAFAVDGAAVLETPFSPRGACGFIAWIDNQYAVVTPQGRFGWGVVPVTEAQTLTIEAVQIERL